MQIDKEKKFSDWYNTIIKDAKLCDLRYNLKGFIVFMPWSVITMEKMYQEYEKELQMHGHLPVWFPALIPEESLVKESDHVAGFVPEVLWVTHAGREKLEQKYAMRPTSEAAMYPIYSLWISGLKDLPLKIYQRAQVWRHETKATKPFIRTRELYWIEAHDAFATREQAMQQVKEDMEMAEKILHESWGIPFIFFKRPQWDKFAGAEDTYAADTILPDGKALQLPSTHFLGQNFSKAYDVKYMDENGKEQFVWQTCYGPGISRIYAALIAMHGDERGLILPFDLAPIQIVIVPIYRGENKKKIDAECEKIEKTLTGNGFSVKFDGSEATPGYKYNEWEMKGVPIRIEIGEREIEGSELMIYRRDKGEKIKVKRSELAEKINEFGRDIRKNLVVMADDWLKQRMSEASDMKQLQNILEKQGGFVRVAFCSDQMEGKACADAIKEKCQANVRGSKFGDASKPKENCISCGKKANIYLYVARQY